jgi:hypothetical protein
MEVEGQLHSLASSSPKKDAPSAHLLRGGMNSIAGLCTRRREGLSVLSGIYPRFLDCPSLSLFTAQNSLFRLHLIIGACEAILLVEDINFFLQLLNKQI